MARAGSISSRSAYRHNPLSEDLVATGPLKKAPKKRQIEPDDEQRYVDDKASRKILKIGRDLVDEAHHELESIPLNSAFTFESRPGNGSGSLHRELENDDDEVWGEVESVGEEQDLDPRDSDLFNKYLQQPTSQVPISRLAHDRDEQCTSLADLILEKIAMHESARDGKPEIQGGGPPEEAVGLPMKVIEVYSKYEEPIISQAIYESLLLTRSQDRAVSLALQIGQTPQAFQDHPHPSPMARTPFPHTT